MLLIRLFLLLAASASLQATEGEWSRYYLTSFPRSGNTWMRYLVEEATGISTSSVYDESKEKGGRICKEREWVAWTPDGGLEGNRRLPTPADPLLVKTHYPVWSSEYDEPPAKKSIFITRCPIDSLYSLWRFRLKGGETEEFSETLSTFAKEWTRCYSYWKRQPNVVMIRYEEMLERPHEMLRLVLAEFGFAFTEEDIDRAVAKYPPFGEVGQHRRHYNEQQMRIVQQRCGALARKLGYGDYLL